MSELGQRAWIFRAADDSPRYIEFLEWKQTDASADPRDDAALKATRARLDDFGTAAPELWIEP